MQTPSIATHLSVELTVIAGLAAIRRHCGVGVKEVQIVAVVSVIVGIDATEAMHREASMATIDTAGAVNMTDAFAGDTADTDAGANVIAGSNASDVGAAKAANVTHTATDVSATQTSDSADAATDVSTAAEAADVAATAKATTHPTGVTAATAATARLCLRSQQARCQQGCRQNVYHLSHRLLHSLIERRAPPKRRAAPKFPMSQRWV